MEHAEVRSQWEKPTAVMAETLDSCSSSDSEPEGIPRKPPLKRRRLITGTAVPAVPVYSNKVQNSLQLLPNSLKLPVQIPELSSKPHLFSASDDDDDDEEELVSVAATSTKVEQEKSVQVLSPSPPPRPRRRHREAKTFDQRLKTLTSSLSAAKKSLQDEGLAADWDDVILIDTTDPLESRELVLKIRCRTDLYRVSVRMMDPLQRVVEHMSQTLKVHPSRILLLLRDHELAADATPHRLGLGVADIIDCIVESSDSGNLQLRVQGKDKNSQMEITVQRGEPLQALMTHYRQAQGLGRQKLAFYFDGQRLIETRTPQELGMESGDVIEVWS
ncbi:NFATC2-interacting protein [Hemicordylus capensis]|uniref:NFATC2-interacting protein n=1 Tax=Hemicordylus capensis TaxID=884348 RepID=UPI0023038799|nr:NFATC2-interacting protein [Hemicordylus capensis]